MRKMKICDWTFGLLLLVRVFAADALPTPSEIWADYDPDAGSYNEEIIRETVQDGVLRRETYISAYVLDREIRMYCMYAVREDVRNAPALLNVHGWMARANIPMDYVKDGWAVLSFDYCGQTGDREHYTRYPEGMEYGNMDKNTGYRIKSSLPDRSQITDPRQADDYLWYALQRRALSYLLAQEGVDASRVGAIGYSYGGSLMWNLAMDPRVKAVVSYFGVGWLEYYRNKGVWMYAVPPREPPMTPGEKLYLSAIAPQAHAPFITAATLWLNGTNDHHGGHERGEQIFTRFQPRVPWSFAHQARGHHNTDKLGDNTRLWLRQHVLGEDVGWPDRPQAAISLDGKGVPMLTVQPAEPERVTELSMYYALKDPVSFGRQWLDADAKRDGNRWEASLPVENVDDYVFAFANIRYEQNIVISTEFQAAIPSRLGNAVATREPPVPEGEEAGWSHAGPVEGVGGVQGFRVLDNEKGTATSKFGRKGTPAPANTSLTFRFYCTQPQTLQLEVNPGRYTVALSITASNDWQDMTVKAGDLKNPAGAPMPGWSALETLTLRPAPGSDITKVVLSGFQWTKVFEPPEPDASGRVYLNPKHARNVKSHWRVNVDQAVQGTPIQVGGQVYAKGLGVHAPSHLEFPLDGHYKSFHVIPGPDDAHHGLLEMKILVDGKEHWSSGPVRSRGFQARPVVIPVEGARTLTLDVLESDGSQGGDHASWAEAYLLPSR